MPAESEAFGPTVLRSPSSIRPSPKITVAGNAIIEPSPKRREAPGDAMARPDRAEVLGARPPGVDHVTEDAIHAVAKARHAQLEQESGANACGTGLVPAYLPELS